MRVFQVIAAITLVNASFGNHFVAAASETGSIEQTLDGALFEGSNGSPAAYFTRNGAALISVRGDSDELVQIDVEDDGSIVFLNASLPEFGRQWRYDGVRQTLVSFDGRLVLSRRSLDRGSQPSGTGSQPVAPGCLPGRCH